MHGVRIEAAGVGRVREVVDALQQVGGFAGDHDTVADSLRHAEVAAQVLSHGAVVTRGGKIGVRLIQAQRWAVIHLQAAAAAHDRLTVAGFLDVTRPIGCAPLA
jgi:hypothetical protein